MNFEVRDSRVETQRFLLGLPWNVSSRLRSDWRLLQTIFGLLPLAHLCNRSSVFNPPLINYTRSRRRRVESAIRRCAFVFFISHLIRSKLISAMANVLALLSDLQTGRSSSTVEVRLLRFWEARNVRRCGELMGVDMLLIDSQVMY